MSSSDRERGFPSDEPPLSQADTASGCGDERPCSTAFVAELRALRTDEDELARGVRLARLRAGLLGDHTRAVYLGRYRTLAPVGRGGMGIVLRARDPELDREVALKVLWADAGSPTDLARMLREAQAMARLSHPNLVAVYEIQSAGDVPFIAMEYVAGGTLEDWLQRPRDWKDVVRTFVEAGRGLEAAHAAGIVHRDFKPSNVLIGSDGRARVTDFGLARDVNAGEAFTDDRATDPLPVLTRTGAIAGTPVYMAPEQHRGEPLGPAADQYAFCVALFEALYGARPFSGRTMDVLLAAKLCGAPDQRADARGVPSWLHAAIARGLHPSATQRWPSMGALLDVLERGPPRAVARTLFVATLIIAAVATVVALVGESVSRKETAACAAEGRGITEVWNEGVRERVRAAFVASGAVDAAVTADLAAPWLDARTDAWQAAQTEACLDARVGRTTSPAIADAASWCLAERRMELEALVAEFEDADATVIREAVVAAATLPSIEACTDKSALERSPAPPVAHPEAVIDLLREMSRADAAQRAGRRAEGITRSRDALVHAQEVGWLPLIMKARLLEARAVERDGRYDESERLMTALYFDAMAIDDWDTAASAASRLTHLVSYRGGRHDEALVWARHAHAALPHVADPAGLRDAELAAHLGTVQQAINDTAQAQAQFERALQIYERTLGSDHPYVASALNALGNLRKHIGDLDQAQQLHERALDIRERVLGARHPEVAASLLGLASVHWARGDVMRALELDERALVVRETTLGPDHPDVVPCLVNMAGVLDDLGEHERASQLLLRALAIVERALGPSHRNVGTILSNLATTYEELGDLEAARTARERAIAILEQTLGPEHPDVGTAANALGALHQRLGEIEAARTAYARAVTIAEQGLGPTHPQLALALGNLGDLVAGTGELAEGEALLQRAVGIYDQHDGTQVGEGKSRFALARLLLERGGDATRARQLAEHAREAFATNGSADELAAVDAWLLENFGP